MGPRKIWFDYLNADSQFDAREVIRRMGWTIADVPDGDGGYIVQLPKEDADLFDFLEMCWS